VAGGIYHVTTRGNARAPIYLDDVDRLVFLDRLERTVKAFEWIVLAYCLMGNHFHLEIRTPEPNIARGMRSLNGWYAQRFNSRYDRTGHLFEGPYDAKLVEREAHFLEVARYVVRNPIRAGLCQKPEEWPWSSHRAAIGLERAPRWLAVAELLAPFGAPEKRAQQRYRAFVAEAIDGPSEPRPRTRSLDASRWDPSLDQVPGQVLLG
jgi:putative transposase